MNILTIIFVIVLIFFAIKKKYNECLLLALIMLYHLIGNNGLEFSSDNNENFSLESIQNATSLLSSNEIVVNDLVVNNGANINNVVFNCPNLNVGNQTVQNSQEMTNILKTFAEGETMYDQSYGNVVMALPNGLNRNMFSLVVPNVSTIGGVTVGDNNNISMIAPNPSIIQNFSATVSETINNVPVSTSVAGTISEAIYNNPKSASAAAVVQEFKQNLPVLPAVESIPTICYVPPFSKKT